MKSQPISVYIHVPFCRKRCSYCSFVSYVGKDHLVSPYFKALKEELILYKDILNERLVKTVYFGGGTPSLVDPHYIKSFLDFLKKNFNLDSQLEVTLEANPENVTAEKLEKWLEAGVNRLSLGFQSLIQQRLNFLGRINTVEQNFVAYHLARQAGFKNINIDLIFVFSQKKLDVWEEMLKQAISLRPEHFSIYELMVEKNTPLFNKFRKKITLIPAAEREGNEFAIFVNSLDLGGGEKIPFNPESGSLEVEPDWLILTSSLLKSAGYVHYEVSNYSLPGFQCLHNLNYWQNGEYIGLGCAASSFFGGYRWWNFSSLEKYLTTVFRGRKPFEERRFIPFSEALEEEIFQRLRLLEGFEFGGILARLQEKKRENFKRKLAKLESLDLLRVKGERIVLTAKGFLVLNVVYSEIIDSIEEDSLDGDLREG